MTNESTVTKVIKTMRRSKSIFEGKRPAAEMTQIIVTRRGTRKRNKEKEVNTDEQRTVTMKIKRKATTANVVIHEQGDNDGDEGVQNDMEYYDKDEQRDEKEQMGMETEKVKENKKANAEQG